MKLPGETKEANKNSIVVAYIKEKKMTSPPGECIV